MPTHMPDTYCIAGINIGISDFLRGHNNFLSSFENFQTNGQQTPDIIFRLFACSDNYQTPQSDFYIQPLSFHRTEDSLVYFLSDSSDTKLAARANNSWNVIDIAIDAGSPDQNSLGLLTDIAFRTRLPEFSGFSLHSSVVEMNGTAILFVGPSGIGKSTQAELWHERYDAPIINGDYGIIRNVGDRFRVFGSPWSGTSPYKVNKDCPVNAVILLEQSDKNEIFKPDNDDLVQRLLPHCVLPYWHEPSLIMALEIINWFLRTVPIYRLKCRPDFEAAEMVYAVVSRQEDK